MADKIMQSMKDKIDIVRYIVGLTEASKQIPDESDEDEDYNYTIDDEEWGNDF